MTGENYHVSAEDPWHAGVTGDLLPVCRPHSGSWN